MQATMDKTPKDPAIEQIEQEKVRLLATQPKPEDYPDQLSYEEARGRWRMNQGRNLGFLDFQLKMLSSPAAPLS